MIQQAKLSSERNWLMYEYFNEEDDKTPVKKAKKQ